MEFKHSVLVSMLLVLAACSERTTPPPLTTEQAVEQASAKKFSDTRKAAEQGVVSAQATLGEMYVKGEGVSKDVLKGIEWYRKAADQGDAKSQLNLGILYDAGVGVPRDEVEAFQWYRKAAENGNTDAQYGLGLMYAGGHVVPRDMILGYAWNNIAAAAGMAEAVETRNLLEKDISAAEKQEAQRLSSQWKLKQSIVREGGAATASPAATRASAVPAKQTTGTLFIVSKSGQAITNYHVVSGCAELRVEGRPGVAKLITDDKVNDLALLQVPGESNAAAPIAREPQKLRQGEDIVVFGFPLNFVLSSGGNLTPGVVSAITGIGNNTNQIQITAPIQPGSSGSPVTNKKGEVVGVVSMKLSDSKMAKATGQVGQNVNFAVSGQTLKAFLDANKVEYRTGNVLAFEKSTADIAEDAKRWTTVVECWK